MKRIKTIGLATALLVATAIVMFGYTGCTSGTTPTNTPVNVPGISAPTVELKTSMRKLWEEHVMWTRNVILCQVDNLPGTEQAVKRLLQNQVDIGNAMASYYGDESTKKLTELLYAHVSITSDVIKGAKAGDSVALEAANKQWSANADEIAGWLSSANPNWTVGDMKMMLGNHIKLTTDEITQRIEKNYDGDVMAYDKVHNDILKMADVFTDGITKQFPAKF